MCNSTYKMPKNIFCQRTMRQKDGHDIVYLTVIVKMQVRVAIIFVPKIHPTQVSSACITHYDN